MLTAEDLSEDQIEAIDFLYQNDQNYLIAKMGAGKSVIALSAMMALLETKMNTRFLIVAPKKVCAAVWATENMEWVDLAKLRVGVIGADELERQRIFANIEDYDIICMNYELMPWMEANKKFVHFDGLCIDEGSKIGAGGKYFKLLRRHLKNFAWRCVMTGTPVSESHEKLFYQMYAVGDGMVFGRNRQKWLDTYFFSTDYNRRKWSLRPDKANDFINRIAPYTHTVPDYSHVLPPLIIQPIFMDLPDDAREVYVDMAKTMKAEGVEAASIGVKMNKMQQIAAGALYSEDEVIELHEEKMKWVERITRDEKENHLIIYQYQFEVDRLIEAYPDLVVMPSDSDGVAETVAAWNHDEIRRLAVHSRSSGHGLNLAQGGASLIWMSPIWSNDQFEQTNARLHRRGQTRPVRSHLLMMKDTIEDCVILPRLEKKQEIMPAFLAHLDSVVAGDRDEPARPRKKYNH